MIQMKNQDLKKITGGSITLGGATLITMGVVFIIGVIDGFVRPLRCN